MVTNIPIIMRAIRSSMKVNPSALLEWVHFCLINLSIDLYEAKSVYNTMFNNILLKL